MIYSDRRLEDPFVEDLFFTIFEFSSATVRDKTLKKFMSDDANAINNPNDDVYYLELDGSAALKVERKREIPLMEASGLR